MNNKLQNLYSCLLVGGFIVVILDTLVGDIGQPPNLKIWAVLCALAGLIGLFGVPEDKV